MSLPCVAQFQHSVSNSSSQQRGQIHQPTATQSGCLNLGFRQKMEMVTSSSGDCVKILQPSEERRMDLPTKLR
ncbi:hypothetical protein HanRHA438_Chr09g0385021 [Helianthus annuus]|nr:hypothetical protein HanIR_Chr09g0402501 [Helianthus annuus]KAJ0541319.1 hypothetical protein HanHA89_Chr09g0327061 [Helianthus annuus]KAJ0706398.1 hypothetical protein HanLR1_Chr09g0306531 [Helianthus annuus]KAJ0710436.1 hypothetical protein HanOQP8_Chr09g0312371 [Helianthus annuus]KAJ0886934.1 hypothetical protein HanRHA438_Chr09g0385021 [Helianthus annuus]